MTQTIQPDITLYYNQESRKELITTRVPDAGGFIYSFKLSSDYENTNVIGNIITLLYFFALYPICLVYGVGITNTVSSFLVNQLGFAEFPRWLLAFSLISLMMFVMVRGKHFMLKVTAWMVYPLIICLLLFSLYLIP